ncbi:MAG: hypothetical protein LBH16_08760 [Treponema sp.]|nr:hypothetical protein [Treponema sp.]
MKKMTVRKTIAAIMTLFIVFCLTPEALSAQANPGEHFQDYTHNAGLGDIKGFNRMVFESHFSKADRELNPDRWLAQARLGISQAVYAWELVACNLYENPFLFEEAKNQLEKWSSGELETRFTQWLIGRFFGEAAEKILTEFSALVGDIQKNYCWWVDEEGCIIFDDYTGDPKTIRPGDNGRELTQDLFKWRSDVGDLVKTNAVNFENALINLYPGLLAYIPEELREDINSILQGSASAINESIKREFENIAAREERIFISRRTRNTRSWPAKKDMETARDFTERLISETEEAWEKGILELNTKIEEAYAADTDLSVLGEQWLQMYMAQFDKGLKAWEEAEKRFFIRRIEWEQESITLYSEGLEIWNNAYVQFEEQLRSWELSARELFTAGENLFKNISDNLEKNIADAKHEFNLNMEMRIGAGTEKVKALVDMYLVCSSASISAVENINFLIKELGEFDIDPRDAGFSDWLFRKIHDLNFIYIQGNYNILIRIRDSYDIYLSYINKTTDARERIMADYAELIGTGSLKDVLSVNVSSEDFCLDEYQIALIKAQAQVIYWEKKMLIAGAVLDYAQKINPQKTADTAGIQAWETAKTEYNNSLEAYRIIMVRLNNIGKDISEKQKELESLSREMAEEENKLIRLTNDYTTLVAACYGNIRNLMLDELNERYDMLIDEYKIFLRTGSNAVYKDVIEKGMRWGVSELRQDAQNILDLMINGDGGETLSLHELKEKVHEGTVSENNLKIRLAGINMFADSNDARLRAINSVFSGADWYYSAKGLSGSPSDADKTALYGDKLYLRLVEDYKNSSFLLLVKRLEYELEYLLDFILGHQETGEEPDEFIAYIYDVFYRLKERVEKKDYYYTDNNTENEIISQFLGGTSFTVSAGRALTAYYNENEYCYMLLDLYGKYASISSFMPDEIWNSAWESLNEFLDGYSITITGYSLPDVQSICNAIFSQTGDFANNTAMFILGFSGCFKSLPVWLEGELNIWKNCVIDYIAHYAMSIGESPLKEKETLIDEQKELEKMYFDLTERANSLFFIDSRKAEEINYNFERIRNEMLLLQYAYQTLETWKSHKIYASENELLKQWREFISSENIINYDPVMTDALTSREGRMYDALYNAVYWTNRINDAFALFDNKELYAANQDKILLGAIYSDSAANLNRRYNALSYQFYEIERIGRAYEISLLSEEDANSIIESKLTEMTAQEEFLYSIKKNYFNKTDGFYNSGIQYDTQYSLLKNAFKDVESKRFEYEKQEEIRRWVNTAYLDIDTSGYLDYAGKLEKARTVLAVLSGLYNDESGRNYNDSVYDTLYAEYKDSFEIKIKTLEAMETVSYEFNLELNYNKMIFDKLVHSINETGNIDGNYNDYISPESFSSWSLKDIITVKNGLLAFSANENMALSGQNSQKADILDSYFNEKENVPGEYFKTSRFEQSLLDLVQRMSVYFSESHKFRQWSLAGDYLINQLIENNGELAFLKSFCQGLVYNPDENNQHPFSSIVVKTNQFGAKESLYSYFSKKPVYANANEQFRAAWEELSAQEQADLEFYIILILTDQNKSGFFQVYNNYVYSYLYNMLTGINNTSVTVSKMWYAPLNALAAREMISVNEVALRFLGPAMNYSLELFNNWSTDISNIIDNTLLYKNIYEISCNKLEGLTRTKESGQSIEWNDINLSLVESRNISQEDIAALETYWLKMREKNAGSYRSVTDALAAMYVWAKESEEENRKNLDYYWLSVMQNQNNNENDYRKAEENFINGKINADALKAAAIEAYGLNSASWKFHYGNMYDSINDNLYLYAGTEDDHYNDFCAIGNDFVSLAANTLRNRYASELSVREFEWDQSRLDIFLKYMEWQNNAEKILENGRRDWNSSRIKLENSRRQWCINFQDEYERVYYEWNEAYLAGLDDKERWLEQAAAAFSQASAEALLSLVGTEGERLSRFIDTREPFGMRVSPPNTNFLMAELLQAAGITGMFNALGAINDISNTVSSVVKQGMGGVSVWDTSLNMTAAYFIAKQTNAEIAEREAKKMAVNAIYAIEEAKNSLAGNVQSANIGFRKSMDDHFILNGFWNKIGNNYVKKIVKKATVFNSVISETVTVIGYENFVMEPIRLNASLNSKHLESLNSLAIRKLLESVFSEIQDIASGIFGSSNDSNTINQRINFFGEEIDLDERHQSPGFFGAHIGYSPAVNSEYTGTARNRLFYDEGEGELGRLLSEYIYWSVINGKGTAELGLAFWDKRLWNDEGRIFNAPTIRSISSLNTQIAGTVAGTIAGAVVSIYATPLAGSLVSTGIQWSANTTNSLFFAALDTGFSSRDNRDIWADFGKQIAIDTASGIISFGAGAAGAGLSSVGSNAAQQAILQGVMNSAGSYTSSVAAAYISAIDFKTGNFDSDAALESWSSSNTIASMLGAGVTASAGSVFSNALSHPQQKFLGGALNLAVSGSGKLTEYQVYAAYNLGSGMSLHESLMEAYDDMGGITLNALNVGAMFDFVMSAVARNNAAGISAQTDTGRKVLNSLMNALGNTGMLEINFGSGGVSAQFGTNGIDTGGALYDLVKRGIDYEQMIRSITDKDERGAAVAAYGYGDWTAENTSMRIASGLDNLYLDSGFKQTGLTVLNDSGKGRRILIQDSNDVYNNALVLIHEAYRNGVVSDANYLETRTAVQAHTEAALAMLNDGLKLSYNTALFKDIINYLESKGNINLFNAYIDDNYNSSQDYYFPETSTGGSYQNDIRNKVPLFGAESQQSVKEQNDQGLWAAYLNYVYSVKQAPGSLLTWDEFKADKNFQKDYGFISKDFISLYMYGCRFMSMKYGLDAVMGSSFDTLSLHEYAFNNGYFSNSSDLTAQNMADIMTNNTDGLYTISVDTSGNLSVDQLYRLSQSQDMYLACLKVSNGLKGNHFVMLSGIDFAYDNIGNPIGINEILVSNPWDNSANIKSHNYLSKQSYSYSEILRWDLFRVTPNQTGLGY